MIENINLSQLLEKVLNISFLELDIDFDFDKLLQEYKLIENKYKFKNYQTKHKILRKKYARSWSGICLISSDGKLYSDMYEGDSGLAMKTELQNYCPNFYQLIEKLGGGNQRARIMRISPHESLIWHSHALEYGLNPYQLTVQVPLIMPEKFEYCVVNKDDFKWYKRFHKPSWFNKIERKKLLPGKAYVFNSYHYHNVYNYSDDYRVTLMLYLDLRDSKVYNLVERSLHV